MKSKTIVNLVLTALFAAILVVLSQIAIPTVPVPFSLGVVAVFLTGALLPKQYALYAALLYLLMGAVGLPVFAGFKGGLGVLAGPTGGYLVAYPIMAFVTAWLYERLRRLAGAQRKGGWDILLFLPGMLLGLLLCYALGSVWYVFVGNVSWAQSLAATVAPFVLFDLCKIAVCAVVGALARNALAKTQMAVL